MIPFWIPCIICLGVDEATDVSVSRAVLVAFFDVGLKWIVWLNCKDQYRPDLDTLTQWVHDYHNPYHQNGYRV